MHTKIVYVNAVLAVVILALQILQFRRVKKLIKLYTQVIGLKDQLIQIQGEQLERIRSSRSADTPGPTNSTP